MRASRRFAALTVTALLLAVVFDTLFAEIRQANAKPSGGSENVVRIVEAGLYTTTDAPDVLKPTWVLKNSTTDIKIASGMGFGIRYALPGPYAGKTELTATITLVGAFAGPSGPVGFEFQSACTVKDGQCIGEMIAPIAPAFGSPRSAGRYTIRVTYKGVTVEKTFVLSN